MSEYKKCSDIMPKWNHRVLVTGLLETFIARKKGIFFSFWKCESGLHIFISPSDYWRELEDDENPKQGWNHEI